MWIILESFWQLLQKNQVVSGGAVLAAAGFLIAYLRSLPAKVYTFCKRRISVTLDVQGQDEAFTWISLWLARNLPNLRDVSVVTKNHDDQQEMTDFSSIKDNRPKIFLTPAPGTHLCWFRRRPMIVTRNRNEESQGERILGQSSHLPRSQSYSITYLSRDVTLPRQLLEEARDLALPRDGKIDVRVGWTKWGGSWKLSDRIRPRSIESVVLADDVHLTILADLKDFLASYERYAELGIPYRRGYLLYGEPGNGKTSLVVALASALGMNIYILSLLSPGLDDTTLVELLTSVSENSVLLMEDVDCAFQHRKRKGDASDRLTFSGLLNGLDGVGGKDGRVIFMTTNHVENLDRALVRPGRIDVKAWIGNARSCQIRNLFQRFFRYADETLTEAFVAQVPEGRICMAALQGHLMKYKGHPEEAVKNAEELFFTDPAPCESQKDAQEGRNGQTPGPRVLAMEGKPHEGEAY